MDSVEEVKARLGIEEVVGQYVELKRSGSGLRGLCPFHQEKTPSFYISPSRGTYHCFGCGEGGDIFSFLQAYEKIDFREALRRLADRAGVELVDDRARIQQAEENQRLYQANAAALEHFRDALVSSQGRRAARYLDERRISESVRQAFGIGYAIDSRRALHQELGTRGFTDEELLAAGLVMSGDGDIRDRFHGRVVFAIRDLRGRVTGFGGRSLGDAEPKYLNSPQTDIFDKSRTLFGIDLAQEAIRTERLAVVVEGYVDAIRAHQCGFKNVVASLGTAITVPQLQICSRLAPVVVLALDPDTAGQEATVRAALSALAGLPRRQRQLPDSLGRGMVDVGLTVDLRVARIPPGAGDPDELIERDPQEWRRLIEQSVPAFQFYFDTVVASADRSQDAWRQQIIDRILPVIQDFPFAVGTQAAWIERLADVTGIQPRLLQNRLPTTAAPTRPPGRRGARRQMAAAPAPSPKRVDPRQEAEDALLRILLQHPCPPELAPALGELRPARPEVREILARVGEAAGSDRRPHLDGLGPAAAELARRLATSPSQDMPDSRVEPAVRLHIAMMRLWAVKQRMTEEQQLLAELGPEDRENGRRSLGLLYAERADLEVQIDELNHKVIAAV